MGAVALNITPNNNAQSGWYAVQIKPNAFKIAARNLERQGFELFLPQLSRTVRRNGRFQQVSVPLFPGYLFVAFNPQSAPWRVINSTSGVARLVSFVREQGPVIVPDRLIETLRSHCDESGCVTMPTPFKEGDAVSVVNGPFADLVGRVQAMGDNERVWVLLDILGNSTRVSMSTHNIWAYT